MGADSSIRGRIIFQSGPPPKPTFRERVRRARRSLRCWECGRTATPFAWGVICYALGIAVGAWVRGGA